MVPDFLKISSEAEIKARGILPSGKLEQILYTLILKMSTVDYARNFRLYSYDNMYPDIADVSKFEIYRTLQKLEQRGLIRHLFVVVYDLNRKQINMVPYYASRKEDESWDELIDALVHLSVISLEQYISTLPDVGVMDIQIILESDSEARFNPATTNTLFQDVLSVISVDKFQVPIDYTYLEKLKELILIRLAERKSVLHFPGYGMIPLKGKDFVTIFETACSFMEETLPQKITAGKSLERCLRKIDLESRLYYENPSAPITTEFCLKKTESMENTLRQMENPGKKLTPGMLSLLMIRKVADTAREMYREKKNKEDHARYIGIKTELLNPEKIGMGSIAFFQHSDITAFPDVVWENLIRDSELVYGKWEFPEGTIHALSKKDKNHFRKAVHDILMVPAHLKWQILILKVLIEESEEELNGLFHDKNFVRDYGKLLRSVYIPYMPWYYKIFQMLGLNWFQDKAFPMAKEKLMMEQKALGQKNQSKVDEYKMKLERLQQERKEKLDFLDKRNMIINRLDDTIFNKKHFPTQKELQDSFPDLPSAEFARVIRLNNFQTVKYKPQLENGDSTLILHPYDTEWLRNIAHFQKIIEIIFEKEIKQRENPADLRERLLAIKKFIEKSSGKFNLTIKEEADPYRAMESEIQKSEARKLKDLSKYL